MNRTDRLDWNIRKRAHWFGTHLPTGTVLTARSHAGLIKLINRFDAAQ